MALSAKNQISNNTKTLIIATLAVACFILLALLSLNATNNSVALNNPDSAEANGWFNWNDHSGNQFQNRSASAVLKDASGSAVAIVRLSSLGEKQTHVNAIVYKSLPQGFHGFHIHTIGKCDAPDFTSAGGHFNPTAAIHSMHAGDMPSLLADASGRASLDFTTDRFTIADLMDTDGSAIILHAGQDNYANIPSRYSPPPDTATQNTGDAGSRSACGVIQQSRQGTRNNRQ